MKSATARFTFLSFCFILIIVSFAAYWFISNRAIKTAAQHNEETFVTAFNETGANFTEAMVQSWGLVDNEFHTAKDLAQTYDTLAALLGTEAELSTNTYEDKNYGEIILTGKTAENYEVEMTLRSSSANDSGSTYIIISLTAQKGPEEALNMRTIANSIVTAANATPTTTMILNGTFGKLYNDGEKRSLAGEIFNNGEILETASSDGYLSYSGFIEGLEDTITSGDNVINFQAALYDDETENTTNIILGTPLIFSEY